MLQFFSNSISFLQTLVELFFLFLRRRLLLAFGSLYLSIRFNHLHHSNITYSKETSILQSHHEETRELCLRTYKCLHGLAPEYLSRSCMPLTAVPGRSQLRSADDQKLVLPRTSTVTLGPRAFCWSGPASWNSLTVHLQHPDLKIGAFRLQLKTVLFVWVSSLCRIIVLV